MNDNQEHHAPTKMHGHQCKPSPGWINRLTSVLASSRFVIIICTLSIVLLAMAIFILASWHALITVVHIFTEITHENITSLTFFLELLEIINTLLKGVIFYVIGVGFYTLFVQPIEFCAPFQIRSLADIEKKIVSIIVLIMTISFMKHFLRWHHPEKMIYSAIGLALVVLALVAFHKFALNDNK